MLRDLVSTELNLSGYSVCVRVFPIICMTHVAIIVSSATSSVGFSCLGLHHLQLLEMWLGGPRHILGSRGYNLSSP